MDNNEKSSILLIMNQAIRDDFDFKSLKKIINQPCKAIKSLERSFTNSKFHFQSVGF